MKATKKGPLERIKRFLQEVRYEVRKVVWPTRRETITYTSVVVVSVVAIGLLVWAMDAVFSFVLSLALR
ncbi:MAG: preprotein translocase subunit SecE [Bacillota bacterium]|jgi:preprotein translocase subunit SecE